MSTLVLLAPVSGPLLPLEHVPDPVFAAKMVGDGVSIDPVTATLLAPCDAEVAFVHPSGHAITLRTADGVELILHIGLDTVTLRGEGFLPLKKKGDRVRTGEPLIDFAADYVATRAPSLLTQVVIATSDRVSDVRARTGYVQAGRDVVLEAVLLNEPVSAAAPAGPIETFASHELFVRNPTGLHARPAALLASTARRFRADVRVRRDMDEANARSVTALMALEISAGDRIVLRASGEDASAALDALVPLVETSLGKEDMPADAVPERTTIDESVDRATLAQTPIWSDQAEALRGVAASPGIAIGEVVVLDPQELPTIQAADTPEEERQKLDRALAQARQQLRGMSDPRDGSAVQAGIFRAHLELLDDPDLVEFSEELIANGTGAVAAWHRAFSRLADRIAAARSDMFAERAADVRDVGRRVLRVLTGVTGSAPAYPKEAIVIAHELTPSETATLDRSRVRGFCTVTGGKTSHVAILARSLGLPAVAGIDPRALELASGTRVILDGTGGTLLVNPPAEDLGRARTAVAQAAAHRRAAEVASREPAVTRDGHRIEVAANIGTAGDAAEASALGADGVGLLRSEFLFLDRPTPPDEDEQYEAYAGIVRAFGADSKVIIRTLDVGGDKPLAYLPLPKEENPFLGIRGIRLASLRADLLRTQLRAILRASGTGRVHVMFPMVATFEDWTLARGLLEEERRALGVDPIPAGIMVEVPAAALMADLFARDVDFFSIGTNDLTQYTLAMDRGHAALAPQVDALHPAVLQLIDRTVRAAHAHGRWVGVCGALASEEAAVPILLGLGIDELSVSIPVVPSIKARVRPLRIADCRDLASRALSAATAADVRALVAR